MSEYGEPWRIKDPPGDGREIVNSSGEDVAGFDGVVDCASRIVACVNACAGIPTDQLQDSSLTRAVNRRRKFTKAIELLDLYFGPSEGILDRKEAFLKKHGWTKREGSLGSVTMGGATSTPLVWEWVKGDRVAFLASALADEVTEQYKRLKDG